MTSCVREVGREGKREGGEEGIEEGREAEKRRKEEGREEERKGGRDEGKKRGGGVSLARLIGRGYLGSTDVSADLGYGLENKICYYAP